MNIIKHFLNESVPQLKVGDIILIGKWRNRVATIKGFGKDKNNQPTIKTDKGEVSMFKFRVNNLLPKDMKKTVVKEDTVNSSQETTILNEIKLNGKDEVRFVLRDIKSFKHPIDKTKSLEFTDHYLSRTKRIRVIESAGPKCRFEEGQIFVIDGEPGQEVKKYTEIEKDVFEKLLKSNKVVLYISEKGFGIAKLNGMEMFVCKVISRIQSKIIFDEIQIEFEGLKSRDMFDKLNEEIVPVKIFQMGLYDYSMRYEDL